MMSWTEDNQLKLSSYRQRSGTAGTAKAEECEGTKDKERIKWMPVISQEGSGP